MSNGPFSSAISFPLVNHVIKKRPLDQRDRTLTIISGFNLSDKILSNHWGKPQLGYLVYLMGLLRMDSRVLITSINLPSSLLENDIPVILLIYEEIRGELLFPSSQVYMDWRLTPALRAISEIVGKFVFTIDIWIMSG